MNNLQEFVKRRLESDIYKRLSIFPATLVLGSRQCGKSTLVKMLARERDNFVYLDLQNISDLNRLTEPLLAPAPWPAWPAVVTKDVTPGTTVVGNPVRLMNKGKRICLIQRKNCCGKSNWAKTPRLN